MKRFIKMLVLFGLILGGLSVLTDCFISYRLRHSQSREFKAWGDIYLNELHNDVLISGGSRAWVQYDPMVLDSVLGCNAWNIGIDGSSINRQIIRYNTYCRVQGHAPKLLIQNIDFATIGFTQDLEREQFFPFFFYDRQLMRDADKYEQFSWTERFIPCFRYYGYRDVIMSAITGKSLGNDLLAKGFYGRDLTWDGALFEQMDTISVADNPDALALFDGFICDVKESGTNVVFVYAPIYYGVTEKIPDIDHMYSMFGSIAEKHGIPVLDYNNDTICFSQKYFYNATHLNRTGAKIFSHQLATDIDSLGLYR